jgi:thiol:disulfide interchange protein DsbD
MIPILSSIIVGQGDDISTSKAFTLSLTYVLAMAVTYTVAGVIVGLSGENIQVWFQNPWVLSVFAGIFVLLSLAMFGFYELQMPSGIQNKLNNISSGAKQGSYVGAGIMGLLSALIVGPCVTAPLIGALIYIAETGNAWVGGIALFSLSMGMGAPLLAIGTSAGKILPKAGAWMDAVKAVFGVLLLGLAIWMLERFLPAPIILLLTGALLIVSAIYLGALDAIKEGASGWSKLWKGMGLISLVYGGILVIGAAGGSNSLLQPLQGIASTQQVANSDTHSTSGSEHALPFQQVKGVDGLQTALAQAAKEGRPVMLDFYADWCVSCKEMEAFTFSNGDVQRSLQNFVMLQADVTKNDAQDKALLKELGLFGPPAILFYDNTASELRNYRVVGFMDAGKFSSHVESFKQTGTIALNDQ